MIIILRGISGAGKSRLVTLLKSTDFKFGTYDPGETPLIQYIKSLWSIIRASEHKFGVCSADDYFMVDGEYKFDAKHLGAAHSACLRNFTEVVRDLQAVTVVDNTNCSIAEMVPYAALASAFAQELHLITIVTDPIESFKRNQHKVPFANVIKQDLTLRQSILDMPPWFPQQIFAN